MKFRNSLKPIRGVLPETLRMLLQVTHGSAFCSQQASYVRVGVWLTVVKGYTQTFPAPDKDIAGGGTATSS